MLRKRRLEFVLTAIAGITMLGYGIVFLAGLFVGLPSDEMLDEIRTTLGEEGFRMFVIRNSVAGLASGSVLVLLSMFLNRRPEESRRLGAMIIIISVMSIMGMGFLNLGILPSVILGVAGGALAILKAPKAPVVPKEGVEEKALVTGAKEVEGPKLAGPVIFRCSQCGTEFGTDEELRAHVIKLHLRG